MQHVPEFIRKVEKKYFLWVMFGEDLRRVRLQTLTNFRFVMCMLLIVCVLKWMFVTSESVAYRNSWRETPFAPRGLRSSWWVTCVVGVNVTAFGHFSVKSIHTCHKRGCSRHLCYFCGLRLSHVFLFMHSPWTRMADQNDTFECAKINESRAQKDVSGFSRMFFTFA